MDNPILLQKQIRENTNDLFEFSKDLKSWGDDMKRKEEAMKKGQPVSEVPKKVPKIQRKPKTPEKPKTAMKKIGSTDYAAWDKFDADAEIERLEDDLKDDSELTDECNDSMYDEAIIEKEKGNKYVKNQEWEKAIQCYTKAIDCYSYDAVFYANRALCYLKLNKYEEAENDCNLSIKLDDTYVKAYQRRAAARMMMNKYEHAEVDLQKVLIIEPKNKEAKAELAKISTILKRDKEKADQRPVSKFTSSRNKSNPAYSLPKEYIKPENSIDDSKPISIWPTNSDIIEVKTITKPPHLRSQKPLHRVEITEIDGLAEAKVAEPISKHVIEKQNITENPKKVLKKENVEEKLVSNEEKKESTRPLSAFRKQKCDTTQLNEINSTDSLENKYKCINTEDLKVVEKIDTSTITKDLKNTVNDTQKMIDISFVSPKNSVQFYLFWKNSKSTEDKYRYLKLIHPQDIPKIFLNSLESNIFSNILDILAKHFIEHKEKIYDYLFYLTEVKRFSAIVMFLSGEDKSTLWKLLDYIKETNEKEKKDVDLLIEKYEL